MCCVGSTCCRNGSGFRAGAKGGLRDPVDRGVLMTDLHSLKSCPTEGLFKSRLKQSSGYWRLHTPCMFVTIDVARRRLGRLG